MTPAARLQAAVEVLDEVIGSARDDGAPADTIVTRYFKQRRYAGSKDRRAVRELVFRAIRRTAERPLSGRSAILGLVEDEPDLAELFGQPRGPEPRQPGEVGPSSSFVPAWLNGELSPLVTEDEWPALLDRAPLDLRVNIARASRDDLLTDLPEGSTTSLSPWGIRMPPESRVDDRPAYEEGLFEIQDEGSQLIALACAPTANERIVDLCAGGGGKSLALAAAAPSAEILATDSNRMRLANLPKRAERARASIQTLLLDPPREVEQLAEWRNAADL